MCSSAGWPRPAPTTSSQGKRVYYLSLEFLIGRLLHDSLNNLGLVDRMRAALAELGVDYDRLRNIEHDAALGNGGLGRLAACFMESMATLCIAAHGYGIRYNHGMFRQVIKDGWQQEYPENWLAFGNPWEVARPDATHPVGFGGTVETQTTADGSHALRLAPGRDGGRGRLRHAGRRLARTLRQHAAALVGAGSRSAGGSTRSIAATMSARWRRGSAPTPSRRCSIRAMRRRRDRNCGCARNIFFTSASLQDLVGRHMRQHNGDIRTAARQGGDPVERHASGDRGRRADAHPGRSARTAVGRGVADHQRHDLLHQPHAAARGAGELAGVADGAAAAAPYADRLPDQPAASGRGLRIAAAGWRRRSPLSR